MRNMQNLVTKYTTPDTTYPDGSAKDDSTPGDKTGTELKSTWVDELLQSFYALIREVDDTPNNIFERPGTSQVVDTIRKWMIRNAICNYTDLKPTGFAPNKMAITTNDDIFVICGNSGLIITSKYGLWWQVRTSGTGQNLMDCEYSFLHTLFLTVGLGPVIIVSSDGITWNTRTPPADTDDYYGCDCDQASTVFLAVGANGTTGAAIDFSVDATATTWFDASLTGTTQILRDVEASQLVAVGNAGAIVKSFGDLTEWFLQTSGTSNILYAIAYSPLHGRLVAVGENETILSSDDSGITWVARTAELEGAPGPDITGVNWVSEANMFIATCDNGSIIVSRDGITWITLMTYASTLVNDFCYNQSAGLGIICGFGGNILPSFRVMP